MRATWPRSSRRPTTTATWSGGTGEGDERVEIRRVLTRAEMQQRQEAEDARVAAKLADEQRSRDVFMTQPSVDFRGLTNGQVAGIRAERDSLSIPELAAKYATTEETIDAVLAGGGG